MIKLSLFMNEPLMAHELYQQEVHRIRTEERSKRKKYVECLENDVKQLKKSLRHKDKSIKKVNEQLRQKTCEVKSYQKKMENEYD